MEYFFAHPYFKVMRFFMLLIGQWPYDQSKMKSVTRAAICLLFAFTTLAQIRSLIGVRNDFILFIEIFPPAMISFLCLLKYCTCWINMNKMKDLLEFLKYDWSTITVETELQILGRFTNVGRLLGLYYMISTYLGIFFALFLQLVPPILDIIVPLNESRPRKLIFDPALFLSQEEHYYIVLALSIIIITVVFTVSGASDLIYLCYLLHACGILNILAYRLKHMFNESGNCNGAKRNDKPLLYLSQKVGDCVQLHCRIIKYHQKLVSCYDTTYLMQFLMVIILLPGLLVHLCDGLTVHNNLSESMSSVIHISGLLFVVFLNILPAQMLLNSSGKILHQAYSSHWYLVPWQIQKSVVIIMQNSVKPRGLCAYSLITASLQVFATILQTSISYFTVLYSIR